MIAGALPSLVHLEVRASFAADDVISSLLATIPYLSSTVPLQLYRCMAISYSESIICVCLLKGQEGEM
jgi:hypothetical protein